MRDRNSKIGKALDKQMEAQLKEMNLLKKRLEERLNKELKKREIEHNNHLQRYANEKKEMETRHKNEENKFFISFKSQQIIEEEPLLYKKK